MCGVHWKCTHASSDGNGIISSTCRALFGVTKVPHSLSSPRGRWVCVWKYMWIWMYVFYLCVYKVRPLVGPSTIYPHQSCKRHLCPVLSNHDPCSSCQFQLRLSPMSQHTVSSAILSHPFLSINESQCHSKCCALVPICLHMHYVYSNV